MDNRSCASARTQLLSSRGEECVPIVGSVAAYYDVAIVGAGPVGSLCALAHARNGAQVALLEANVKAAGRLAGEWLHPPAARMLRDVGIDVDTLPNSTPGIGFVVFPEDGSEPIQLPCPDGSLGLACDHALLVSKLHEAIEDEAGIDFFSNARVSSIEGQTVRFISNGQESSVAAARIAGADGRASLMRKSLGLSIQPVLISRMLGVTLRDTTLPFAGYGHVVLGGPGPIFLYRLADGCVRVVVDVPLDRWIPRDRIGYLSESCAWLLPGDLGPGFVEALQTGRFHTATNQLRPRVTYGNSRRVLIGDAAGHYHPMTAVGMTLGFGDAVTLAEKEDFQEFVAERLRAVHVPEMLAMGLYEVFADYRGEAAAVRGAVYRRWRKNSSFRNRTMQIVACENRSVIALIYAFVGTIVQTLVKEFPVYLRSLASPQTRTIIRSLAVRLWWLQSGFRRLRRAIKVDREESRHAWEDLARAFPYSIPAGTGSSKSSRPKDIVSPDAGQALNRAAACVLELQGEDGAWEGEMVWCPMLTAQYVLLCHIIGERIEAGRRRRVLRLFERTRLESGQWGMHEHSPPHLFVTTLVYVAVRLLGVDREARLIAPARRFIQEEDVLGIPSWGKFWLALLNLYDWNGVNAVLPELWSLPRRIPLHPSNWYCHTRLIYMGMASIYARRYQAPVTPVIAELREELFPQGFDNAKFSGARNRLRDSDLFARPTAWLRAGYGVARLYERFHSRKLRTRCMDAILRHIRWELQTTSHTSISPVSGILNILALWLHDPDDADFRQALSKLDSWIWEDEEDGLRVTGARSASWDTGFALQALAAMPETDRVRDALGRGADFLLGEQIRTSFERFREAYRADPKGGWCFAGGWHGWPVSDCTAEAVLGLVAAHGDNANRTVLGAAADFMLRSQNPDGGFGSYEARRSVLGLEWLNPAEMFGESMTEHSFVECTASCIAALSVCRDRFPEIGARLAVSDSIARGAAWLRQNQMADGSWRGVWGVQYIYGTLFGIRGLIADGSRPSDPALRAACRWLLERQRNDGGWGEHHSGCLSGRYVPHEESQVIQTSWALIALLEAGETDWAAISRGARFLLDVQEPDGTWPKQDMAGVFFRTALLDYALYRRYFPLQALGLYERRRRNRLSLASSVREGAENGPG